MNNLIRNPDFEIAWDDNVSHETIFLLGDDDLYVADIGNIWTPSGGWKTWLRHIPGTLDQPEVKYISLPERVWHGNNAMLLFTMYRKHDAGFLQQVPAIPGFKVTLSAWAHAWSNWQAGPHPDDARWSEGAGYDAGYILEGDAPNDEWANFTFYLGIDPTGGIDARAAAVIWGLGAHIYNIYAQVPVVEAVAESGLVTVFLRSKTAWPYKHNDAYWDNTSLEISIQPPRGLPREQYERTYVLLPQDATIEEMHVVVDKHTPLGHTIGQSADDAGIGDLDVRRVIAYRPSAWPSDLKAFFEEYYPGVEYIPVLESTLLWMGDPLWKDARYADGRCYTIGTKGCWIADCAMAQRYFSIDAGATPLTVDAIVGSDGYTGGCEMWHSAMPALGLEVAGNTTDIDKAKVWLDQGNICFAEVEPASLQHFVMVVPSPGDGWFWMFDPAKNVEGWVNDYYDGIESFRLIRPYTVPDPPDPPDPGSHMETISFHIQTWEAREQLDRYLSEVQPGYVKLVEGMEQAYHVHELSPNSKIGFRHCVENQGQYLFHSGGPDAGAEAYIDTFRDSLLACADVITHVESLNEELPTDNMWKIERLTEFEIAFCHALERMGFPARPITYTAGVGNPQHGPEVAAMIPGVRVTIEAGGGIGYHTYWGYNRATGRLTLTSKDWKHYAGRALESWDPVFRAAGLFPEYFFGEGGPIAIAAEGNRMNVHGGWRHPDCLNGDRDMLIEQIMEFRRRVAVWRAAHGNRDVWLSLFTIYGFGWPNFQYRKEEIDAMRIAFTT